MIKYTQYFRTIAAIITVFTTTHSKAFADDSCQNFNSLYEDAYDGFRDFKGLPSDKSTWDSTITLPGADSCDISEDDDEYRLSCTWPASEAGLEKQAAAATGLARTLKACLGSKVKEITGEEGPKDEYGMQEIYVANGLNFGAHVDVYLDEESMRPQSKHYERYDIWLAVTFAKHQR